ncbi:MAG: hypothetical protein ACPIOQ_16755 [Promethearchaeia archaeon]
MDVTRMRPLCWRQESVCGSWKAPDGSAAQTRVDARRLILLAILLAQQLCQVQVSFLLEKMNLSRGRADLEDGLEGLREDGADALEAG